MDKLNLNALILDDGYQNPKLKKDISFLVVDGVIGFGNESIFPSGPLRESVENALKKADEVIIIGSVSDQVSEFIKTISVPVFYAKVQEFFPAEIDKETKLVAFCGLAFPKKFFNSLEDNGFNVIKKIPFPDHYLYSEKDISGLREKARSLGAKIITTEKDYVRLTKTQKKYVNYVPIELCWENKKEITKFLNNKINICPEKTS
jgi:tetraacyldisaccharide 4'-kinase